MWECAEIHRLVGVNDDILQRDNNLERAMKRLFL